MRTIGFKYLGFFNENNSSAHILRALPAYSKSDWLRTDTRRLYLDNSLVLLRTLQLAELEDNQTFVRPYIPLLLIMIQFKENKVVQQ